jgi:hypothetical protein
MTSQLKGIATALCVGLFAASAADKARAEDPTVELLTAPYVRSYVRIAPDPKTPDVALDGKDVDYTESMTFVATNKVKFVIADYNPLTMDVKFDAGESDDPSHAALQKFVAAFFKTFAPESAGAQADAHTHAETLKDAKGCPEASEAATLLIDFDAALRPGEVPTDTIKRWAEAAKGREGMRTQAKEFASLGKKFSALAGTAQEKLDSLKALRAKLESMPGDTAVKALAGKVETAQGDVNKATTLYVATTREAPKAQTADATAKKVLEARASAIKKLESAEAGLRAAEQELAAARAATGCPREVLGLLALFLRTQPDEQVARLARLGKSATELATSLTSTADSDKAWYPPSFGPDGDAAANAVSTSYVLNSKGPKVDKIETVTVTATRTTLAVGDDGTIAEVAVPKSDSKTVFRIRRRALFVPELGAGLVLAAVHTPTYGAVKDEKGVTVVAKTKVQARDFKGALMLNAVCRCWNDSFFYPMLQFGLAADKDAPALFAGFGFRFIRPKGFGFSAGAVLAWVKDLDTLRIGAPVEAQAVIDANLKAQPTVKPYFSLHYTF